MIRTAIVEDDDKIRNNLIDLLEKSGNFRCVAAYSNAEDALADIPKKLPDIVLMDINLPEMDGIECTEKLKAVLPGLLIVMLTVYEDANKIFNSLQAGAVGYLLKLTPQQEILAALTDVSRGGSPMSAQIARKVVQSFHAKPKGKEKAAVTLTNRAEKPGSADWEPIGFVQGHGNSNSPRNYEYTDLTPPCGKVSYRLRQVDFDGKYKFCGTLELVVDLPKQNSLLQNYPNPFNPATIIRYQLSQTAEVSLVVYDMAGREAAVLAKGQKSPGYYEVAFDGSRLASGIYVYMLKAGDFIQTKKLVLLK